MTMLEIWFSFPGDCVFLPGEYSTTSLIYHFEIIFGKIRIENSNNFMLKMGILMFSASFDVCIVHQ